MLSFTSFTQEQIEFANVFKPESEYIITSKSESKSEITYDATEKFINYLKSKGIENPQITESTSIKKIAYITGVEKDLVMPIEIKYLETGESQDGYIKNGQSFKGTYSSSDKIKITELPNNRQIELDESQFISLTNDGFNLDLFNNGTMKVGDSVIIKTPINFPVGPYKITLDLIDIYVLKGINSGKSNFDIISIYELKSDDNPINLSASGGGTGSCIYDNEKMRVLSKESELKLVFTADFQEDIKIKIVQESKSIERTEIK